MQSRSQEGGAADQPAGERLLAEWISRPELAEQFGLSVDTLERWENQRKGPPCVRIGRKVLYRKDAVRQWLIEQEESKLKARGRRS